MSDAGSESSDDGRQEASGGPGENADDYCGQTGDGEEPEAVPRRQSLNLEPMLCRDAQQIGSQFRRVVEVVPAKEGDALSVAAILDSVLHNTVKGHESDEGKRREEDQSKHIEGRADVRRCGHRTRRVQRTPKPKTCSPDPWTPK